MPDDITGLPLFRDRASELAATHSLAVLVDIDALAWLNDQLGHDVGDQTLAQVAQVILARTAQLSSGLVLRVGGDEFLAVLPTVELATVATTAAAIVEDVRALRLPFKRLDDPARTHVEINAAIVQVTPNLIRIAFSEWGITRDFSYWIAHQIYRRKQESGHAGVVVDVHDATDQPNFELQLTKTPWR